MLQTITFFNLFTNNLGYPVFRTSNFSNTPPIMRRKVPIKNKHNKQFQNPKFIPYSSSAFKKAFLLLINSFFSIASIEYLNEDKYWIHPIQPAMLWTFFKNR